MCPPFQSAAWAGDSHTQILALSRITHRMLSIYMYSSTTTMTMWPPCGNFSAQTVQNYHICEALHVHMGLANKYVMIFSFPEWVYLLQHNYIRFLETHEYLSMVLGLTRGTSHSSSCTYLWYMSNIWYLLSRNLVAGQSHMLSLVKLCSFTTTCMNTETDTMYKLRCGGMCTSVLPSLSPLTCGEMRAISKRTYIS